jgi:hypothetical protein
MDQIKPGRGQRKRSENRDDSISQHSFGYVRQKLGNLPNKKGNRGKLLMGHEAREDDGGVIDWNFDHDDLTKAIHNIASENLQWVQFPIFGEEEAEGSQDCSDDDSGRRHECVSELSDGIVQQAREDNEELDKIKAAA